MAEHNAVYIIDDEEAVQESISVFLDVHETLGISLSTAEVHRANVMEKMNARSLSALMRMAISVGSRG